MLLEDRDGEKIPDRAEGLAGREATLTAARGIVPFRSWRFQACYAREESAMAASDWGLCKDCQWWQIDPEAKIADNTMGLCTEEATPTLPSARLGE